MSFDPAENWQTKLEQYGLNSEQVGVVIVDHGSRRSASNELLLQVASLFQQVTGCQIVEPAHMELAEPSISTAFDRVVQQGAVLVVVHPYFLAPGRHWSQDIPNLAASAASRHSHVRYLVTAPLGLHPLMIQIMRQRIDDCLRHTLGDGDRCALCVNGQECQIRVCD